MRSAGIAGRAVGGAGDGGGARGAKGVSKVNDKAEFGIFCDEAAQSSA